MGIGQASISTGGGCSSPGLTQNAERLLKSEMPLAWNMCACVDMQKFQEQKRRATCWLALNTVAFLNAPVEDVDRSVCGPGCSGVGYEGGACKPVTEDL